MCVPQFGGTFSPFYLYQWICNCQRPMCPNLEWKNGCFLENLPYKVPNWTKLSGVFVGKWYSERSQNHIFLGIEISKPLQVLEMALCSAWKDWFILGWSLYFYRLIIMMGKHFENPCLHLSISAAIFLCREFYLQLSMNSMSEQRIMPSRNNVCMLNPSTGNQSGKEWCISWNSCDVLLYGICIFSQNPN